MPLIPVGGGVRVMPSLGYALAPYGAEWTRSHGISARAESTEQRATDHRTSRCVSEIPAPRRRGASASRAADVLRVRGLPIGLAVDVWRQPELLADQTSDAQHTGAGAMGTVVLPLPRVLRSRWSEGIHISAGYKSQGFVPGEQLSGGGLRAGIALR